VLLCASWLSRRLPVIAAALILPGLALAQPTDDAAKCQASAGSYLTGTVVSGPRFKPGAPPHGTYLSHTHLTLRSDAERRAYDVAIDNVFANGYRHNQRSVPAPLNAIKVDPVHSRILFRALVRASVATPTPAALSRSRLRMTTFSYLSAEAAPFRPCQANCSEAGLPLP
jgi:hypothetical protein